MAGPKCLMGEFTNLYEIYEAQQTNVWWTMKVFRLHWFKSLILILDSTVYLSMGSLLDIRFQRPWVRTLHSAEEDNLSPCDLKIACLCLSMEINNNGHDIVNSNGPHIIHICIIMAHKVIKRCTLISSVTARAGDSCQTCAIENWSAYTCTSAVSSFDTLWPSDAMWWHRTGSTLAQVMACCLTAPSHYLNKYWFINSKVSWHSYDDITITRSEDTSE